MKPQELSNLVSELNDGIPDKVRDAGYGFAFNTDGYEYLIEFQGFALFSSANDERDTDEDGVYEITVREYVLQEFDKLYEYVAAVRDGFKKKTETEETLYDTIAFYSEDPRRRATTEHQQCTYETEDGRHCAVGRLMTEEQLQALRTADGLLCSVKSVRGHLISSLEMGSLTLSNGMKLESHNLAWWQDLQRLHDQDRYWDDNGLTERGLAAAKSMCEKYGMDPDKAIPDPIPRPQATTQPQG